MTSASENDKPVILLTRPAVDGAASAQKLANNSQFSAYETLNIPFLKITATEDSGASASDPYDAILFTSANAVRHFKAHQTDKPAFTVGNKTAQAARDKGYQTIHDAGADAKALAALIRNTLPKGRTLFFPRGRHIARDLKQDLSDHCTIIQQTVYESRQITEPDPTLPALIKQGRLAALLLYSKRTAEAVLGFLRNHGLERDLHRTKLLCLSPSVLEYARTQIDETYWRGTYTAPRPQEAALFETLEQIITNTTENPDQNNE